MLSVLTQQLQGRWLQSQLRTHKACCKVGGIGEGYCDVLSPTHGTPHSRVLCMACVRGIDHRGQAGTQFCRPIGSHKHRRRRRRACVALAAPGLAEVLGAARMRH